MELFKKKKKEDDAEERQTPQEMQEVQEAQEAVEVEEISPAAEEENPEDAGTETSEAEGLKLPAASEIAATLGHPELEAGLQETLAGLQAEIAAGRITDETVRLIALGLDYERAVKEADAGGEIRGRNAAIEERLLTRNDSDGIPHPGGGHGAGATTHAFSIFDLARSAR